MHGCFAMENISKQKKIYCLTFTATEMYNYMLSIQSTNLIIITYQLM